MSASGTVRKRKVQKPLDDLDTPEVKKPKTRTKTSKPAKSKEEVVKATTNKKTTAKKQTKVDQNDMELPENQHDDIPLGRSEGEMLSHLEKIPQKLAENFIALLSEGCTLPFIARYRKTVVENLMPDR